MALLQQLVTNQAERAPEATALVLRQENMSYGELEESSSQLSRILKEGGCRPGDRVCFLMPKSPAAIVSLLGILKADCIYVPLDPASPAPRLAKMVEACEPRWILAADPSADLLDELLLLAEGVRPSISIGWLGAERTEGKYFKSKFSMADFQSYSGLPLDYRHRAEDAAHILFTSGSTGAPKGVVISHSNVLHFVDWANRYFGMSHSDRNSGHSPLHFDLSTFDIFGTLAVGAQLHLVPPELNLLPNKLADFIRTSALTQWFSVPSVLSYMAKFDVVVFNDFPTLKRLLWCGEVFPTSALLYWMKHLPRVTFTNLYGPTEATIASSYYKVPACPTDERASIPIGSACEGEELLVLDERLRPVSPGEIGDLYIRGAGLSPGYWRDAEKTQVVFLPNPNSSDRNDRIYKTGDLASIGDDGLVYFRGRADSQIKSRGYRIELGEIEAALNTLDFLQESAVVALDSEGFQGATIGCAYVSPLANITHGAVRKELSKVLPNYMLPTRWLTFEKLPKNGSGKIDRVRLKEQFRQNETQTA